VAISIQVIRIIDTSFYVVIMSAEITLGRV